MTSVFIRRAISALTLLLTCALALSACTRTVEGTATLSQDGVKKDAEPSDLQIENSDGGEIDQLVANSMDDVMSYWEKSFPKVFGEKMPPLKGGIHAYEPNQSGPIPCFADNEKQAAANNAFYCPTEDAVAYDRAFLGQLVDEFGEFIVPLVFAHEFGHAIQARVGVKSDKSIALEGQADCYAGAFTKAAAEGTAHFKATDDDLDSVLGGYLMLRDEPGYSADEQMAHGTAFDRVGAFQEGFNDGAQHCVDAFGPDREYTEIQYTTPNDKANDGNLSYDKISQLIPTEMNSFGKKVVGGDWSEVEAAPFDGGAGTCDGKKQSAQVFYCGDDKKVYFGDKDFVQQAYDKYGDFASVVAVGLGYGEAMLQQSNTKLDDKDDFKAQLCLTGAYAGAAFAANVDGKKSPFGTLQLSAGDLDEAVSLLIGIGEDDQFVDTHGLDAFDRINTFREAVLEGRQDPEQTAKSCLSA